ncbi:MAG: ferrous iron transport protein B, partial [Phycisphaeraceae bacterium]|nr:ferrous iron transport protein B [Phycisphaeraceae bacterium]
MVANAPAPASPGLAPPAAPSALPCIALAGNPNAGKTTLFNQLTGLRAKTANFPGTTIEHRIGRATIEGRRVDVLDLPGLYSLHASSAEENVAALALQGELTGLDRPSAVVIIVDATNLQRNLYLVSQVVETGVPSLVALNMTDLAERAGILTNAAVLSQELGLPVVPICARSGKGLDELRRQIHLLLNPTVADPASGGGGHAATLTIGATSSRTPAPASAPKSSAADKILSSLAACGSCSGCPHQKRYDWAEGVWQRCQSDSNAEHGIWTDRLDKVFTHPVAGVLAFFSVMAGVFLLIFWLASYPMDWIGALFAQAQHWTAQIVPEGDLRSLLTEGVVGGVGGMLVFLPQIGILFFFLALLEDTGYLARAAFVMDRLMRRVGLPGKAFVPLLSAHACAIPAIMSARVIEDKRDRLVTILVLPLMTCSARIPVYAMVAAMLFPGQALRQSLLFTGAYALGIITAITVAFAFKRTILPGQPRPLVLELPGYKVPSLRNATLSMLDRSFVFIKNAGTLIFLISVILWALATYPKSDPPAEALAMQQQAQVLEQSGRTDQAQDLISRADQLTAQHALAHSAAGRVGHFVEPVLAPLGFDWQIGVGVVSSLAAREVIVSTLAVIYGIGDAAADENRDSLYTPLRQATRSDGSPVFTTATCLSLLVFYVLAMQCLPTQAVTKRET